MPHDILINVGAAEVRVAVVEGGKLQALSTTRTLGGTNGGSLVGDIVLGRVVRVLPAVQAAFVEIGQERAGFLGLREARSLNIGEGEPSISQLVGEGDAVLVQIIKDPIGDKGARLTTSLTIPGRYCVLTPSQPGVALSRRIEDEAERVRLAQLGEEVMEGARHGVILRTAAIGVTADELRADVVELEQLWSRIAAAQYNARIPATLHRDLGPVERALRDMVHEDTARVLIDDVPAVERARAYCRHAMPDAERRVAPFDGPGGLFDDLESDIDALLEPRVPLPCGGWITLEGTEALTAIDVNSGRFSHASAIEDTGLTVNLEAAAEIGRQVRLRGIGGVIVIDFIHMQEPEHVERVQQVLAQSLARDRTPFNIGGPSEVGLVEITRKRVRDPLVSLWSEDCPHCRGLGQVRRIEAVAMEVIRQVERAARAAPGKLIRVEAAPDVVRWLEGEGAVRALANKGMARVEFSAVESLARDRFDVGTSN